MSIDYINRMLHRVDSVNYVLLIVFFNTLYMFTYTHTHTHTHILVYGAKSLPVTKHLKLTTM